MDVLVIRELTAGYHSTPVLRGISLRIAKGEKVVLMGPSGSGKSTLLKCIVRLVEPWSGTIIVDGTNVLEDNVDIRKVRQKVGFVFQSYNLFPHMTVLRNITLPLEVVKKMNKKEAIDRALQALKVVDMVEFKDKYPLELSGGQQQRVAIARALAIDPVLLLLDEPTSALDPELREEVLETLRNVAKRGISMLIVTHELDFAEDVADRILFMDHGMIVEEGVPYELLYSPKKERTRSFLRTIFRRLY
ncbi:MAG: peptide ABC transporter ATP-binding protein, partial [Thermoprotei archaeon]